MTHTLVRSRGIGPALIVLGSALLITRLVSFGGLELPFLSAVLIIIGLWRRESAWFIPGGLLAGVGLGHYLTESPFAAALGDDASGGVFLLSFALGWACVFVLSKRFGDTPNTWALIPALAMGMISALLLSAGIGKWILDALSYLWPLGLVALGAYLVLRTQHR